MQSCPRCGAANHQDRSSCWKCWASLRRCALCDDAAYDQEVYPSSGVRWGITLCVIVLLAISMFWYVTLVHHP